MTQQSISLSPEQAINPPPAESAAPEKPAVPETPEARYVRQFNEMLHDAIGCHSVEELADTLCWGLAIIASNGGIEVAGDIVRRLGGHIRHFAERDRVQAEAEQARQAGLKFQ